MIDTLTTQIQIEELFNSNQTLPRLRKIFRDPNVLDHCKTHEIDADFAVDCLSHMVLHKRAKISTLVAILRHHFMPEGAHRDDIPSTDELQDCADAILKMAQVNLVSYDNMSGEIVMLLDVTQDVHEDFDRYEHPLPLIIPPQEIKTNKDKGYYSPMSCRGSVILGGGANHHDDDVCLDHLNRVNQTPLNINFNTATMVQNQWRNLDRPKEGEDKEKFQKRVRAFEKFDRTAKDVLDHISVLNGPIYLTHNYDSRGRTYARGYHINPQGNDWSKAIVELAEAEPLSEE